MVSFIKNHYKDQYQALREVDGFESPEFRLRMILIGLPVTAGYFAYDLILPLVWFFLYGAALWALGQLIRKTTTTYSRKLFLAIAGGNFAVGLIFVALPVALWLSGVPIFRVAAVGLCFGAMMHSMSQRASLPMLALGDAAATCIFVLVVMVDLLMSAISPMDRLIILLMSAAMIFYSMSALFAVFRVRARLREATMRSAEAQKMHAVGQLTGGIAHDFNNILTVVTGNLELYHSISSQKERTQLVNEARSAADRASVLTSQLLAFSRKARLRPAPMDVQVFLNRFWDMTRRVVPEDIRFDIQCPDGLPKLRVDKTQLEAALLNLTLNARDAMAQGGELIISAKLAHLTRHSVLAARAKVSPGAYIQFTISDTGHGVPARLRAQIFEPFFTTKNVGEGSGLGLSQAKGFAEQSNGCLLLDSSEGLGTSFILLLPLLDAQDLAQADWSEHDGTDPQMTAAE